MSATDDAFLLGTTATRVLLAVLAHEGRGGMSVREIGDAAGLRSPSSVLTHLRHLRRLDLVDWEDRLHGTIRARVRIVASG